MYLRPINLPIPIILSSSSLLVFGFYVTIFRTLPSLPIFFTKHKSKASATIEDLANPSHESFIPPPTTPRIADTNALFGIISYALVLPYFVSSYMPIDENQFLYASVPIRLCVSGMMLAHLLLRGRTGMSESGFWEFVAFAMLDGGSAMGLGLYLGRFDGRIRVFD
ncbi:hypothetical protein BJX70DRAFT_396547 [Aspergillus crustosus]